MLTVVPLYVACALWPLTWSRDTAKKLALLSIPIIVLTVPWMVALRVATGHWTAGESGTLNFAWEMCGAERWTHWQGEPGTIGQPLHPTRRVVTAPAVYEFAGPIASASTYAPWYDPAYWYRGVKPSLTAVSRDGIANLLHNLRYLAWLVAVTPGVFPSVLFLPVTFKRIAMSGERILFAVLLPPATLLAIYALVFVDKRYAGGSLLILALVLMAQVLPQLRRKWQVDLCSILSLCGCIGLVSLTNLALVLLFLRHPLQVSSSEMDVHRDDCE